MPRSRWMREISIMACTCLALYHAGKSVLGSVERQVFLHSQALALKNGQRQAMEVNRDLRSGLANYRSSSGIERLARERLNLAAQDEIMLRIGR